MTSVEKKNLIEAILDEFDVLPRCVVLKHWGTPGALVSGEPDIMALIRGRHVELSVRDPQDRLNSRERERMEAWKQAGAIVATVSSIAELRRVLDQYGFSC